MNYLPMRTFGLSVDTNGVIWEYQGAIGFVPVGQYLPVYPPTNVNPPLAQFASGGPTVGNTAITNSGTWAPAAPTPTYTRQWFSGGTPIGTGTTTYVLQASDVGNMITCQVTATNVAGSGTAMSNALGPVTEV